MRHVVISFIGKDKPGIVDALAKIIQAHQGNWQTSSMRHLSGFFVGILEVCVADEDAEGLVADLAQMQDLQVQLEIAEPVSSPLKTIRIDITANDRQGIIGEISAVVHKQGGNMLKLVSSQGSAAHTGQTIFKATANIALGTEQDVDALISALEGIADDLIVDIIK
ncbi:glycine cleavage system protein R [Thalassotalea aquiviva]|uniref:glycine cleavage system protein R n=1 Tax=Thalassotalea aquiviva TaxID=3242415 RepID=UPI00352A4A4F